MSILIVYYSRTGRTKKIAEHIQRMLNADIDEIIDIKNRNGFLGWLSAGRDAGSKALSDLTGVDKNPGEYSIIVIGSPTWSGSLSTPIRTYIDRYRDELKHVAIFSTGDGDEPDALIEMKEMLGGRVFAGLHLVRGKEVDADSYQEKIDEFTQKIKSYKL